MLKQKFRVLKSVICTVLALSFVFSVTSTLKTSAVNDTPPKAPSFSFTASTKVWGYNLLLNRGLNIAAYGINLLAGLSENEAVHQVASIASFLLTGTAPSKDNSVYYEQIMASIDEMCETVVREIEMTEQSIKEDLSAMSTVLGILNKTAKMDNYNEAWEKDVMLPLSQASLTSTINAYKTYVAAAGDYTNGSAENTYLISKKNAFIDSLRVASGAVYDASSANGMTIDEFYNEKIFCSNAVDLKFKQAITEMLTRLEATDGTRYIDTAAQMAYTAYPFSTDQAEFVDNAARKQSEMITVSILAYREFIAMRHEYIAQRLSDASSDGMEQSEYDALENSLNGLDEYGNELFNKLFYGSDEIQPSSGVVNGLVNWLESKIIVVNGVAPCHIYLDNYSRRTPNSTVTLENTSHVSSVDYEFYKQESENGNLSPLFTVHSLNQNTYVKPEAFYNEAVYTSKYMEFEKTAVLIPSESGGQVTVRPVMVLANDPLDENDRKISSLYGGINYLGVDESHIKYPLCDYYNLTNGAFTDGYNTYSVASDAGDLKRVITDEALVSSSLSLDSYFSSLEHYSANYIVMAGTSANHGDNNVTIPVISTASKGLDVENEIITDISECQYSLVLVPDSDETYVPFECIVEGNGSVECELSGYECEQASGRYLAGTLVAVNIKPPAGVCCAVEGVTVRNYADASVNVPTSEQVIYSEGNSYTITYNDDGSLTLAFRVAYEKTDVVITVHEYYDIATVDDLTAFADVVNSGVTDVDAVLSNTIDISSFSTSIGTSAHPYGGVFDGNGHSLTGYNGAYTSINGIFSYLSGGTVKNLTVDGECTVYGTGNGYGGIIGTATDDAQIINVHSSVDITVASGSAGIGGIVGTAQDGAYLYKCSYSGTITTRSDANNGVGGIAGCAGDRVKFAFCINYGTISSGNADTYMGGIAGYTDSELFGGMEKCVSVGSVGTSLLLQQTTAAGSIIGYAANLPHGCMSDCYFMLTSGFRELGVGMLDGISCTSTSTVSGIYSAPEYAMNSGQITHALGVGLDKPVYVQTLGDDPYPVFIGLPVYLCARYACDGVTELELIYSNQYNGNEYNVHVFDDETHACEHCGKLICEIYTMGDANDDGTVNTKDIIRIKAYLGGFTDEIYFYPSDLDHNGTIDYADLDILVSMIAG